MSQALAAETQAHAATAEALATRLDAALAERAALEAGGHAQEGAAELEAQRRAGAEALRGELGRQRRALEEQRGEAARRRGGEAESPGLPLIRQVSSQHIGHGAGAAESRPGGSAGSGIRALPDGIRVP